ncbi:AMP-binding protein [Orrella marina]|nr:AMP-binding protein [Orrella marina]
METIPTSFSDILLKHPDLPAYVCLDETVTRAGLARASDRMAGYLKSRGVERGDTICVWLPDGGVWLQLLFACARLGVLMVPVSTRLRHDEALHIVKTAQGKLIFVQPEFVGYDYGAVARQIQSEVQSVQDVVDVFNPAGLFDTGDVTPVCADEGELTDLLCTFSTSGTTGNPKLATHTQYGILRHAYEVARFSDVVPGDSSLCAVPLYGVLGFMQALSALAGAGQCVFMQTFNLERAAELVEQHRATHFYGGEGLFDDLISVPGKDPRSFKVAGFAEFNGRGLEVTEKARRLYGIRMIALYGSSECFSIMAGQSREQDDAARAVPGGKPICRDIEFRVADLETGETLPKDQRGELQFRGYNVMAGYLNNPDATSDAFTEDGWFRSGDLGYVYADRFSYVARIKDTMRLRGYLVDPVEIEEFLFKLDGVKDAQVVAYRHPGKGDMAVAFVRKLASGNAPDHVTEQWLYEQCRAGLANYKVPSHFVFVGDYPRKEGPNGLKILKNKIRDMAQEIVMQHNHQVGAASQ